MKNQGLETRFSLKNRHTDRQRQRSSMKKLKMIEPRNLKIGQTDRRTRASRARSARHLLSEDYAPGRPGPMNMDDRKF